MILNIGQIDTIEITFMCTMVNQELLAELNSRRCYLLAVRVYQLLTNKRSTPINLIIIIHTIEPQNLNNLEYQFFTPTLTDGL